MQSFSLIEYGKIDLHNLKEIVQAIPLDEWTYRTDPESYETRAIRENDRAFPKDEIQKVLGEVNTYLPEGYQNRIVLSCVPARKGILPHIDDFGSEVRSKSAHYHIPLITHEFAIMGIDGKEHHLKEGFLYLMDETKEHYVINPSNIDRIHLLFAHFPHGV